MNNTSVTVNSGSVNGNIFTANSTTGGLLGNGAFFQIGNTPSCAPSGTFTGTISNGSGGSGNILNVTSVPTNSLPLVVGSLISDGGITGTLNIIAKGTGTGGIGTYTVSANFNLSSTFTGTSGQLTFVIAYDGLPGTVSAGIGGGGHSISNGSPSEWHMEWGTAGFAGFQDDGMGAGLPTGVSGNVLTVTNDPSMNMLSPQGVTVNGFTVTGPVGSETGGVGQYKMSGSAVVAPGVLFAVPTQTLRGGWSIPPGVTTHAMPTPRNSHCNPVHSCVR